MMRMHSPPTLADVEIAQSLAEHTVLLRRESRFVIYLIADKNVAQG